MSIQVMSAVWERSTAYGGELLIMLAIANYADINGRAFPSIRTLALDGRMTERNAQYCIQKLEALGEIKVERNAGPHGTHIFHVLLQGESFSGCKVFTHKKKRSRNKELTSETGENFSGVQLVQTETHFTGGVKPISPEPSVDPSVKEKEQEKDIPPEIANAISSPSPDGEGDPRELQKSKTAHVPRKLKQLPSYDPDGYQQFIAGYPSHSQLLEAVKAWDWLKPDATLQATIMADIEARKVGHQQWAEGYITHPATYLRGARWLDDLVPLKSNRVSPKAQPPPSLTPEQEEARRLYVLGHTQERPHAGT